MNKPAELRIAMQTVDSSQIHSIGYDPQAGTLAIRFKDRKSGNATTLYHYGKVTPENFDAFRTAPSIGSHFHKYIKPFPERFPFRRIDVNPAAAERDEQ